MTDLRKAIVHIGGSHAQLLSIRAEKESGLAVIVTDRDPQAPAAEEADFFITADATYSDGIMSALEECSGRFEIVGAYGVADYAFKTVGAIHARFAPHLCQADIYGNFTNKFLTNAALARRAVPQPLQVWSGQRADNPGAAAILERAAGKDLVVKSATLNNSSGVVLLDDPTEASLAQALEHVFSRDDYAVVEEKLKGRICNVDGFMAGGEFHPISTTYRLDDPDRLQVCTAMIQPADSWPEFFAEAAGLARSSAHALGYRDGPFTVDLIDSLSGPGGLKVLEASPHFHLPQCDWLRGNGNPLAACAAYFGGDAGWNRFLGTNGGFGACVQLSAPLAGRVSDIAGLDALRDNPAVRHFSIHLRPGMSVTSTAGSKTLIGLVWLVEESAAALRKSVYAVRDCIDVRVDNEVGS